MAQILINKNKFSTNGDLNEIGSKLPHFSLIDTELNEVSSESFAGQKYIMNIFPSIDTGVCATSVKAFAEHCIEKNILVLNISKDLPFAHLRFNQEHKLFNVVSLSAFRSNFGIDYQLQFIEGALLDLFSRVVLVVNEQGELIYKEQVPILSEEPQYQKAIDMF